MSAHDNAFSAYVPTYKGLDLIFEERLWGVDFNDYQVVDVLTQIGLEALTGRSVEPRVHKRSVALPFSFDEAKAHGPDGAQILWERLRLRIAADCRFSGATWSETVFQARIHDGGSVPDDWVHDGEMQDLAEAAAGPLWSACSEEEKDGLIVEVQNGAASEWRKLQRRSK